MVRCKRAIHRAQHQPLHLGAPDSSSLCRVAEGTREGQEDQAASTHNCYKKAVGMTRTQGGRAA